MLEHSSVHKTQNKGPRILYLEPFNGGSHAQFSSALTTKTQAQWTPLLLPGRHWKWRARGSAVYFVQNKADILKTSFDGLWASSFLPLQDFVALAPKFSSIPKVLYFHENQLAYPNQPQWAKERDHHFGISQMISALVATHCVFNSQWNLDSFLESGEALLRHMPDALPKNWIDSIRTRSRVLPVPLELPEVVCQDVGRATRADGPIILWNHRWEHDKNPESFFRVLMRLADKGVPFRLAVCGERYRKYPAIFDEARERLVSRIIQWGTLESRMAYEELLQKAQIVVSTAFHEFFGVSMVEATHFGAHPLVPNRLAYPEIFPTEYRYNDDTELENRLAHLCFEWVAGRVDLRQNRHRLTQPYGSHLWTRYQSFLDGVFPCSINGQGQ